MRWDQQLSHMPSSTEEEEAEEFFFNQRGGRGVYCQRHSHLPDPKSTTQKIFLEEFIFLKKKVTFCLKTCLFGFGFFLAGWQIRQRTSPSLFPPACDTPPARVSCSQDAQRAGV